MLARLLTWLLDWLTRSRREAAAAEAQVEAVRQRAAQDDRVEKLPEGDAMRELRGNWHAAIALALLLSSCTPPPPVVVDTACDWVRPILVRDGDQFTDPTARAVLAHNELWQARCPDGRK